MDASGSVNIGGTKVPKPALIIGGAAGVGILFYAYWSRSGGSGGGGNDAPIDPNEGIDPLTGLPYADQFGFGSGYTGIGVNDPATGGIIGGGYGGGIVTGATTNAMWVQAAILYLEGGSGEYTRETISVALGKVLTGQPLTQAELNIFNAARAVQGEPPQPYPPIQMVSAAPGGTTNPSGSSLKAPAGLHILGSGKTWISIGWKAVPGAKGYYVYIAYDPPGGSTPTGRLQRGGVVGTSYTENGLKSGKRYRFDIKPLGFDGKTGAQARVYGYTKK